MRRDVAVGVPAQPGRPGQSSPARRIGRSEPGGANACTSTPTPVRGSPDTPLTVAQRDLFPAPTQRLVVSTALSPLRSARSALVTGPRSNRYDVSGSSRAPRLRLNWVREATPEPLSS